MNKTVERGISLLAVGLLVVLSLVPLRLLLLLFSRPLALITEHVIGYRKHVVTENLHKAFPEKNAQELATIRSQFYLHFADLFFETIRLLSAPRRSVFKRSVMSSEGVALLNRLYGEGKSVITLSGHFGNWEYQVPASINNRSFLILPVYRPLRNKAFDWLLAKIRSRFADELITDKRVARTVLKLTRDNTPGAFGLVADQSPNMQHAWWLTFLNQDTPVFSGPEKMARAFKLPVVFLATRKVKRGAYNIHCELIAEHPELLPEGELTKIFFNKLADEIRRQPAFYLWSHRRWKHRRKVNGEQ